MHNCMVAFFSFGGGGGFVVCRGGFVIKAESVLITVCPCDAVCVD